MPTDLCRRSTTIDNVSTCSSLLRPADALELLCRLFIQIQLSMTHLHTLAITEYIGLENNDLRVTCPRRLR